MSKLSMSDLTHKNAATRLRIIRTRSRFLNFGPISRKATDKDRKKRSRLVRCKRGRETPVMQYYG